MVDHLCIWGRGNVAPAPVTVPESAGEDVTVVVTVVAVGVAVVVVVVTVDVTVLVTVVAVGVTVGEAVGVAVGLEAGGGLDISHIPTAATANIAATTAAMSLLSIFIGAGGSTQINICAMNAASAKWVGC
jgi:hypothetical protein